MEELQQLVNIIKDLPTLGMVMLGGYMAYKLAVLGSIYGIIRLFINKLHSWLTTPKVKTVAIHGELDGVTMTDALPQLLTQITRIMDVASDSSQKHTYIYSSDVRWLQAAIDAKVEDDKARRK